MTSGLRVSNVKDKAMNVADAEREIVAEWHRWKANRSDRKSVATDPLIFYGHLRGQRPDLLAFKCSGDRWKMIRAWLVA
jgi:hypothetical protein